MSVAKTRNGGAFSRSNFVAINKTATAGSTGDATEVDGAWVDRALTDYGIALSAKLTIAYTTALAGGETLTFAVQMQDDALGDGADPTDVLSAVAASVAATGDSGGSTETGTIDIDLDLSGLRQFFRAQVTPNLSASGTDTAEWAAVIMLYGGDRQPSSQAIASLGGASSI